MYRKRRSKGIIFPTFVLPYPLPDLDFFCSLLKKIWGVSSAKCNAICAHLTTGRYLLVCSKVDCSLACLRKRVFFVLRSGITSLLVFVYKIIRFFLNVYVGLFWCCSLVVLVLWWCLMVVGDVTCH